MSANSSSKRIKLDLSDFVKDLGARRWMLLTTDRFSTVSDLVEQLKEEYSQVGEGDSLSVFLDGDFILPPWESVDIIQPGDLLRVTRVRNRQVSPGTSGKEKGGAKRRRLADKEEVRPAKKSKVKVREHKSSSSSSEEALEEEEVKTKKYVDKTVSVKATTKDVPVKKNAQASQTSIVAVTNVKLQGSGSSDSSDSSDTEEETIAKPVTVKPKQSAPQTAVKIVPQKQEESSSSSSDSDTDDDSVVSKTHQKSAPPPMKINPPKPKSSSSDSSSSEDEEESPAKIKQLVAKPPVKSKPEKEATSSSSSDSDEEIEVTPVASKTKSEEAGPKPVQVQSAVIGHADKPKRKRKRKNKNKNKLSPDQIPDFGAPIQPAVNLAVAASTENTNNSHVRFGNENGVPSEGTGGDEVKGKGDESEEFTAEDIQKLYSLSKPAMASSPKVSNGKPERASSTKASNGHSKTNSISNSSKSAANQVSCESVVLGSQDQKVVSNNLTVARGPSATQVAFKPRVLHLKEMKVENVKNRKKEDEKKHEQVAPLGDFSELLNGRGQVFGRNGKVDVYENRSSLLENKKDYTAYHEVSSGGPRVGDVLAFKVLEMGENYTPGFSDYKEAKVTGWDETFVTLELIAAEGNKVKSGRFEMENEDGAAEKTLRLRWPEVIEPRLMFP